MKIVVCINHVPDTASKISIENNEVSLKNISFILNPYDEFAIEEGLKIKDKDGSSVIILSVGGEVNKETIKKALAMGADEGILLKSEAVLDSFAIASILSEEIKTIQPEIVFMGKQSVDYDNNSVGTMTAELLGYQSVSNCVSLNVDGNTISAEREIEGGREVVVSSLPCVITTQKGLNEPRYASLKGIMAAKKKNITEKNISAPVNLVESVAYSYPPEKNKARIIGTDASAVPELVNLLRNEAKVLKEI